MKAAEASILIVEELIDFIKYLGDIKLSLAQTELFVTDRQQSTNLGFYAGHLNTVVSFSSILATTLEALDHESARGSEYFESLANTDRDIDTYLSLEDFKVINNELFEKFDTLYRAYSKELEDNRVLKVLTEVIIFNLKEMRFYLWR